MSYKVNVKKFLSLSGVVLVLMTTMTACGKKADCNENGSHAHLYKNEKGYVRYIDKEYLTYEGYSRCEECVDIEGQEDLYKFLDKKDLLRIDDNLELLLNEQNINVDYTEYRYRYTYMQPIPHFRKVGKVSSVYYTYIPQTRYSWTSDPSHSRLTGQTRICHHVYVAYKVEKDENGKYVLIPSPQVDDITTVMDEYPYINKKYCKIVTTDGKEVDYEDGKQEEMSPEDKKRADDYDSGLIDESDIEPQSYNEEKGKILVKSNFVKA